MIPSVNPSAQLFLADLSRVQSQIDTAQRQISSGLKISQPSDAPNELEGLMRVQADLARNQQVSNNLAEVKSEVDTSEQALQTATKLMDRVSTLAAQAVNSTQTASSRQSIAQEVTGILQQLVGLSQTSVQGRYVFSGDQSQLSSYSLNLSAPNGVDRLLTTAATRQVVDATGISFTIARTALDIFDHRNPDDSTAADNVFAAVNSLRVSLQNNDQAGISNAQNSLHAANDSLNTHLSFYGSVQNRIQDSQDYSSRYQLQLQTDLSHIQDADITQAALALSQGNTQLNTALAAEAKMPRTSLFDFLG
ncbi:MAG: flagellar hook-associated protein 3 [Bryobacterales bacterium]|nr:flagellar hook-associated protein 3 [Bryobacterales bacterium]